MFVSTYARCYFIQLGEPSTRRFVDKREKEEEERLKRRREQLGGKVNDARTLER